MGRQFDRPAPGAVVGTRPESGTQHAVALERPAEQEGHVIKKMLAGPVVAGALMLAPVSLAQAANAETTPPAGDDTGDDDDDGSNVGLLGLLGLAGLAGLAGLKRREVATRYDTRTQVR